jgi:acyl-CoA thioesterase FadM
MARIKINLPEKFIFSTDIQPRITEINYGGHLGNDALLALAHEARARFLAAHHWSEMDVDGCGLIMVDAALMYLAEIFYGATLHVEVAVADMSRIGCDFVFRLTDRENGREAVRKVAELDPEVVIMHRDLQLHDPMCSIWSEFITEAATPYNNPFIALSDKVIKHLDDFFFASYPDAWNHTYGLEL